MNRGEFVTPELNTIHNKSSDKAPAGRPPVIDEDGVITALVEALWLAVRGVDCRDLQSNSRIENSLGWHLRL